MQRKSSPGDYYKEESRAFDTDKVVGIEEEVRWDIILLRTIMSCWNYLVEDDFNRADNCMNMIEIFIGSYPEKKGSHYAQSIKHLKASFRDAMRLLPHKNKDDKLRMLIKSALLERYKILDQRIHDLGFKPRVIEDDY